MNLEGSHTFAATPERIWELLNDPQVLARTTPGLESLEAEGEDRYKAVFQIKLGPVKGDFRGTLAVVDKDPPRGYRLQIDVSGRVGATKADGTFQIRGEGEGAVVDFAGNAKLSGVLARMGGRVLTGVARQFTRQFFEALEQEV